MQQRLRQTDEELDNLIGVRSRAISRKLRAVQTMDDASAAACWSWTPSRAAPCLPACRKAGAMNNGCGQGSGRKKPQIPLAKFLTMCYTRNCS